ncbi:hypothetical protein Tsubulata_001476 [Turnera subulata]|uniref:Pentacotripeptide-repeat region of PRORP domain-containing protein n=1 Tax=Turnera subulata TaxID=218843 RepID=A0A9Q0J043_9ROSI|nr:hypothetical protein Tsubulata_001476 [Turnera subulata]
MKNTFQLYLSNVATLQKARLLFHFTSMESSTLPSSSLPTPRPQFEPDTEAIKRKLLEKGVYPTPKIIHNIRRKEIQKHNRKLNKISQADPLTPSQKQALQEESHFQTLKREYRDFTRAVKKATGCGGLLVGKPWERIEKVELREIASGGKEEFFVGEKLNKQSLRELKAIFEGNLKWVFLDDDDVDVQVENCGNGSGSDDQRERERRKRSEKEAIQFLVDRLSCREVSLRDWKLARVMRQSGLRFTEEQLLRIVEGLGDKGRWAQAMAVVDWVYNDKGRRHSRSRFVYTKLLSVLGKARRPLEALRIFNLMREDWNIYPDMATYHTIAVSLGQAGLLKELLKVIECMRQRPLKRISNMPHRNWKTVLEPDLVIYNAQLRKSGLKPNGASYGLAMEVMLSAGKYDLVHELFRKMNRSGQAPKALTYKVLVRTLWEEAKVNEAVEAVRDMERRGVVGTASVYYELACCLCNDGRWQDAMPVVRKMKKLRHRKPLEVTFTGLILSSLDGGYVNHCISIFEHMKALCSPNIGTINTMLRIYGKNDLFSEAKELFEEIKKADGGSTSLVPDKYTYCSMLEASARALQWEYFEYVYKEMTFSGYQLDQSKHASLLVDASRAGKCHLLNHAFDAILEAGEIPCSKIFTEMVFQAILQEDYERAAILVNCLVHTPFQVSERQWTDLFQRNVVKFGRDSLQKLLEVLGDWDMASDASVTNFLKSLQFLCGHGTSRDLLPSSSASNPLNNNQYTGDSASMINRGTELDKDHLVSEIDVTTNTGNINQCNTNGEGDDDSGVVSARPVKTTELCETTNLCNMECLTADMTDSVFTDCPDKQLSDFASLGLSKEDDDMEFEMLINEGDDPHPGNSPSAYEILDAWEKSTGSEHK